VWPRAFIAVLSIRVLGLHGSKFLSTCFGFHSIVVLSYLYTDDSSHLAPRLFKFGGGDTDLGLGDAEMLARSPGPIVHTSQGMDGICVAMI
jgi:hypothetical protein